MTDACSVCWFNLGALTTFVGITSLAVIWSVVISWMKRMSNKKTKDIASASNQRKALWRRRTHISLADGIRDADNVSVNTATSEDTIVVVE